MTGMSEFLIENKNDETSKKRLKSDKPINVNEIKNKQKQKKEISGSSSVTITYGNFSILHPLYPFDLKRHFTFVINKI
jgi:hypothetical protein